MTNGQWRTLSDFAWSASLSAAAQRAAVQSALDSGERIVLPMLETVTVDGPLYMDNPTDFLGSGSSQIVSQDPNADTLTVRCSYSHIAGIHFERSTKGNGSDIVVGPTTANGFAIYNNIHRCFTSLNSKYGVYAKNFGGLSLTGPGLLKGWGAAVRSSNAIVDAGDSKMHGYDLVSSEADYGACFWYTAGGGWLFEQNKFNLGYNHMRINNSLGQTGTINAVNNSFEGNTPISCDFVGNQRLKRVVFVGNNWGVLGACLAVRNFVPKQIPDWLPCDGPEPGSTPVEWLDDFVFADNALEGGQNGAPLVDIACANTPIIGANKYRHNGAAGSRNAIILRGPMSGALVEQTRSRFVDVDVPITYAGATGTQVV